METSYRKAISSDLGMEEIIGMLRAFWCRTGRDVAEPAGRIEGKVCIHLIKKHTSSTNRDIAKTSGTLTHSAAAKINESVSKRLAADKELREQIKKLEIEYSLFKG